MNEAPARKFVLPHSPAWADVQGAICRVGFRPFSVPNAGTKQMQSSLMWYAGWSKSNFLAIAQDEVWINTELMIKGIEAAGYRPTHASMDKALRHTSAWNANGLLPFTVDFKTTFRHTPPAQCLWFEKADAGLCCKTKTGSSR
jgi:hypothetical protein